MRLLSALSCTVALALALSFAGATKGATSKAHKMSGGSSALVSKGKALVAAKQCNGCHGADLKGKPGFSPSLHASVRPLKHYTQALFVRLLTKGLDDDGKPVGPPMSNACHQTAADSKAIYAYLKTVK